MTKTTESYVDGVPSANDDRTTEYTYNANSDVATLKAVLPAGAYQETKYVYGVSPATGSTLFSNSVLRATEYPDKATGAAAVSEQETYAVNNLGETVAFTDRAGSVHEYKYDVLGRLGSDYVTAFGSGVDTAVDRLTYAYDSAGRLMTLTSRNTQGGADQSDANIVNRVMRTYNGFGQLLIEYQEHAGDVNTSTSPKVQYAYADGSTNTVRRTSMTYPNGRVLTYNYATGLDADISRLSSLGDTSATLESYRYLGLSTAVIAAHAQTGVNLNYTERSYFFGVDPYAGLDQFGRVADQNWRQDSVRGMPSVDRYQYTYDRDSNRLSADNLLDATKSELFTYDALDRLAAFKRGTLDSTKTALTGTASRSQDWTLDPLGNTTSLATDGVSKSRTHDRQNELAFTGEKRYVFDKNGNTIRDGLAADVNHDAQVNDLDTAIMTANMGSNSASWEQGDANGDGTVSSVDTAVASGSMYQSSPALTYTYDAWNRQVAVVKKEYFYTQPTVTYEYDAAGRRVQRTAGNVTGDSHYSDQWQVLEERDASGDVTVQNVWSPVYVDAMILRDRQTAGELASGFGTGGVTTTSFGGVEQGEAAALTSTGKVLVAGTKDGDFLLARYNADGTLDTTFGTGGRTVFDLGGIETVGDVAVLPSGKILVAGGSNAGTSTGSDFAVARFNADGSVDTTFASSGKLVAHLGGTNERVVGMAVQSDGKIVVTGTMAGDWVVARFTAAGALDTGFGTGGKTTIDFGTGAQDNVQDLVLQSDGRIVAVGGVSTTGGNGNTNAFAAIRLTTGGALDTTFDSDGKVVNAQLEAGYYSVALQPDGKIVAAGFSHGATRDGVAVTRYNTDGSLDTSFSGDGIANLTVPPTSSWTYDAQLFGMTVDPVSGKITAAGYVDDGFHRDMHLLLTRLKTDGSLDGSFDGDGFQEVGEAGALYAGADLLMMPDGTILAVGSRRTYTLSGDDSDLLLVDIKTGGGLDERLYTTYDANYNVTALVNTSGTVVERYIYDPYGKQTVLDPNWSADADNTSDFDFHHGFQGGRLDPATGKIDFRNRQYDPETQRWMTVDPMGYVDGLNLFEFIGSLPTGYTDPLGTNRYMSGSGVHTGVAVDIWRLNRKTQRLEKIGVRTYDFSADGFSTGTKWELFMAAVGGLVRYPGKCVSQSGILLDDAITILSEPEDDIIMEMWLRNQEIDPMNYGLLGRKTCIGWSNEAVTKGRDGGRASIMTWEGVVRKEYKLGTTLTEIKSVPKE